jgi:hypothetical protein
MNSGLRARTLGLALASLPLMASAQFVVTGQTLQTSGPPPGSYSPDPVTTLGSYSSGRYATVGATINTGDINYFVNTGHATIIEPGVLRVSSTVGWLPQDPKGPVATKIPNAVYGESSQIAFDLPVAQLVNLRQQYGTVNSAAASTFSLIQVLDDGSQFSLALPAPVSAPTAPTPYEYYPKGYPAPYFDWYVSDSWVTLAAGHYVMTSKTAVAQPKPYNYMGLYMGGGYFETPLGPKYLTGSAENLAFAYARREASAGYFTISTVPEPGTWALMVLGLGCLGVVRRRTANSGRTVS